MPDGLFLVSPICQKILHGRMDERQQEFVIINLCAHFFLGGEIMEFKKSLMALLLGSSMALAACGGGGEDAGEEGGNNGGGGEGTEETANAAQGEEVYQQSCVSCHGGNLEGGAGPALETVGSKYSKDEILNIIENGKGNMPPNIVQGEEADAVAEWLAAKK